jgi:restriction system protein
VRDVVLIVPAFLRFKPFTVLPDYRILSINKEILTVTSILIAVFFVVVVASKLNVVKGWLGEKATSAGMWTLLDGKKYRRFDNIIVPSSRDTTQIDHVLVSVYGIFVIETKNLKGWIFGSPDSAKWTQSIYGKKYQFQNPLKQNYRHVRCLSEYLRLDNAVFHPVVFFIGDCNFKTTMPSNVLSSGLIPYIKGFRNMCLTPQQVSDIETKLIALKSDDSFTNKEHLASLRQRYNSGDSCPRCGKNLVRRTAQKGANAGKSFWGCSGYPKCKFTRAV